MPTPPRRPHAADLRGATRLLVHATKGVTDVVQDMHVAIAGGPALLGAPLEKPVRFVTGVVYGTIRGVTELVGAGVDAALEQLGPYLGESEPGAERTAVLAALNGVVGDHLAETGNPLAIEMVLCRGGAPLGEAPEAGASSRIVVLVHGSSMSELGWSRLGHDHGVALEADLGVTTLALRYNSGLHISTNGRAFAALLERTLAAWPVPVEELTLLGHSMGGLVARSACHVAEDEGLAWRRHLTRLITLGAPHQGAPLERGGAWLHLLLGVSRYSRPLARLARLRSAGVTDLRFGYVRDEDWTGRDRFRTTPDPRGPLRLPAGVACFAIAGTTSTTVGPNPASDGLVPVESALGQHERAELNLGFPPDHRWIAYGVGHLDLLSDPTVYARLRDWVGAPAS